MKLYQYTGKKKKFLKVGSKAALLLHEKGFYM